MTTGSPDGGAPHVSVTALPLAVAVSVPGAPGAVAPAVATRTTGRAPEKHPASPDGCRHRARSTTDAPKIDGPEVEAATEVTPGAFEAGRDAEGAAGDDEDPHAAASRQQSALANIRLIGISYWRFRVMTAPPEGSVPSVSTIRVAENVPLTVVVSP